MQDISKMSWSERKALEKQLQEESKAPSKVFDLSCGTKEASSNTSEQVGLPQPPPSSASRSQDDTPTEEVSLADSHDAFGSNELFDDVQKVMVGIGMLCFLLGYCSSFVGEQIEYFVENFDPAPMVAAIENFEMPEIFETSFETAVRSGKWKYIDCSRMSGSKQAACYARRNRQERTWRQITFDRPGTMYQFKLSHQGTAVSTP